MHVSTRRSARPIRATPTRAGRTRVLAASALSAALALLLVPNAPTAQANLPVERTHHRSSVHKVKVDPKLFGVHDYYANSLHRAGTGSIRLWDAGVRWSEVFPTADGPPSWDRLDSLVTQAHDNGTEVTLVLGLTPSYAAADPYSSTYPTSMPDLSQYSAYVDAVMSRYSPANWHDANDVHYRGIAAYQVWNEANIATFWTGTYDELGQLTKAVHDVRDQVDPGAKVVAPAMVTRLGYQQGGIKKFYDTKVDGNPVWSYVDAISLNLYPLDVYPNPNPTRLGTPEDSMGLLSTARGLLAKDDVPSSIPIWNTEVNYGLRFGANGGQPAAPIPTSRQVAYVIRTYLLNAAQGVKRVDWYAYDMSQRGTLGPLGNTLLTDPVDRAAGTLTPAGLAFTRVQAWMKGTLIGTRTKRPCIRDKHGTYTCLITYDNGVGRVYWNPYGKAKVTLAKSAKNKFNQYGEKTKATGGTKLKVNYQPVLVKSKK
jgi:polysaccharide biosynthesis protein PslG